MIRDVFYYGNKPNAHPRERHADSLDQARSMSTTEHFWIINAQCDYKGFDWDWDFDFLPDEDVWSQEHNNVWPSSYQKDSGTWLCPTQLSEVIVYRNDVDPVPLKNEISSNWVIIENIDKDKFDFRWHPDPTDPPYIYVWGTKWNSPELGPALEYHTPGSTERKYMPTFVSVEPQWDRWKINYPVDDATFDFTWRPNPREPNFIYKWGCKHFPVELQACLEYHIPDATDIKYMPELVKLLPQTERWIEVQAVDKSKFDMTWRPDPREPELIYVWGNKYIDGTIRPTLEYHMPGATDTKYMSEPVPVLPEWNRWEILHEVDKESFDFSWRPDPREPDYIYVFGNTQYPGTIMPTIRYHCLNATVEKHVTDIVAKLAQQPDLFENITDNFDYSWRPDPTSPPYVYQFGTLLDENDGPRYVVPGNNGVVVHLERKEVVLEELIFPHYYIKTTLEALIEEHPSEIFWALNPDLDYSNFDFKWVPDKDNVYHVNAFGSKDNQNTQTYFVNGNMWQKGYRDINYVEDKIIDVRTKIDMFFIDRGNSESHIRFQALCERFPNIVKTRYLNSWVDTINRCTTKSTTNLCWILNSELDYTDFEFDYYPSPWQMKMVHVFGTQWSHWGTTFMVNKTTFPEDTKYVKVIEHLNVLNFVKRKTAKATNCLYDIVYIDHGNLVDAIENKLIIKYDASYLKTFKTMLKSLPVQKEHYVWVCSSICDYDNFDFSYICDPYAKEQLHVFPSDKQKFGDTFLIDVNKLRSLIEDMDMLEDYVKINYNQHQRVKRLTPPTIISDDTHCDSVQQEFDFPYAIFKTIDNKDLTVVDNEPMSLWAPDTKNIIVTSTGGSRIIVPKEAKKFIDGELYDYPYISHSTNLAQSQPLDIVFLSNGETGADENYEHLLKVTKGLRNRVVRVDGVNGRVAAYHAAALASNTPWMFTVFAKLKVNSKFDWSWQPDRLQIPKHYIFNATNPVNRLEYGHQAMIAYNKKITLANSGTGLDFTLDNEHEVVDINSGVAVYNTDAWSTWRTSFREAIKLVAATDEMSKERLDAWLNVGEGDFAQYSCEGAQHAIEYYNQVNGDLDKLRLSYDWPWLRSYFDSKYK